MTNSGSVRRLAEGSFFFVIMGIGALVVLHGDEKSLVCAGMWRDWDISLRFPFAASVILHTALASFFWRGSIFLLAGAVRWIREPEWGHEWVQSLETSIFDAEIHNLRLFLQNYCSRHSTSSSDSILQDSF